MKGYRQKAKGKKAKKEKGEIAEKRDQMIQEMMAKKPKK